MGATLDHCPTRLLKVYYCMLLFFNVTIKLLGKGFFGGGKELLTY